LLLFLIEDDAFGTGLFMNIYYMQIVPRWFVSSGFEFSMRPEPTTKIDVAGKKDSVIFRRTLLLTKSNPSNRVPGVCPLDLGNGPDFEWKIAPAICMAMLVTKRIVTRLTIGNTVHWLLTATARNRPTTENRPSLARASKQLNN